MFDLTGKTALVTGATGGIGEGIARAFHKAGADVAISGRQVAKLEALAAELGDRVHVVPCDLADKAQVMKLIDNAAAKLGRVDIIVNNAGLNVRSDFRHLSDADWVKIREVNLDGVVRIARDAFNLLKASGDGSLINVSSIMGQRGLRQLAGYSATKGAVTALTKALAVEYAPYNIRVNSVAPGYIDTALTERFLKNPLVSKALLDKTPLRRFGTAEEIARATLFFASADSAYVTGAELAVDGGMTAGL